MNCTHLSPALTKSITGRIGEGKPCPPQTEDPACYCVTKPRFQNSPCCSSTPPSLCLPLSSYHSQYEKRIPPLLWRKGNKGCSLQDLQIQERSWLPLCSQATRISPQEQRIDGHNRGSLWSCLSFSNIKNAQLSPVTPLLCAYTWHRAIHKAAGTGRV